MSRKNQWFSDTLTNSCHAKNVPETIYNVWEEAPILSCMPSTHPTPFLHDILYERYLITNFSRINNYVSFLRLWHSTYSTKHFSNKNEQLIITQYLIWYILIFISFITQWSANATLPTTYKDQRVVSFFVAESFTLYTLIYFLRFLPLWTERKKRESND